ncbi:MAG: DNA alkylation repair protein, partial [Bacteroidaceae bacterium]|nr:DNA alkylation repair protein [Bacteroidaceae bacterium]
MTTEETVREVKKALRSAMNGVLSAQMRQAGMPYRLVFGVELPRLREIAREFPSDRALAQNLWNQPIRECKMLAAMLMPI